MCMYNGDANACAVKRDCLLGMVLLIALQDTVTRRERFERHTLIHTTRLHTYVWRKKQSRWREKITLKLIIEGKCLIKCTSTPLPFWNCIKKDSGCCWWFCCWSRRCCWIWCWCCFIWCRRICTAAEQCRYASVGRAKDLFSDRNSKVTRTEITR